jgi:carbon-monoxide dehydrogenase small subunit
MPEKEKENKSGQVSRRQFIKGAGIVIGGTAVGSTFLLSACGGGDGTTTTVTRTNTTTATQTQTATQTVTTTAGGSTQTVTTTAGGMTKYVCPFDNIEFDTLAALKAHLESEHGIGQGSGCTLTTMIVNGSTYGFLDIKPYSSLLYVLREKLGLFGAKNGCNMGECGTCTVIMNGKTVNSCLVLAVEADGASIETIEGQAPTGRLNQVQQILYDKDALQCGYCVPGVVMSATALWRENPNPTLDELREAISGHMCTCGNLNNYMAALLNLR